MKSVLLFTPGIDSLLALYSLEKQKIDPPILVYYGLRSRYTEAEIQKLQKYKLPIMMDTAFNFCDIESKNAHIPNRNILLATHAAGKYDADIVYIGGTKSDRVSDNNEIVMLELSTVLSMSMEKDVTVTSPFWNKYKIEVAKEFVSDKQQAAITALENTFSCFNPEKNKDGDYKECLRCSACFRKNAILFSAAGIKKLFKNPSIPRKYLLEFEGLEDPHPRAVSTLEYIQWLNGK